MTKAESALYLELFHGRGSLTQEMEDWGTAGPVLGPLHFVHTTYAERVHLRVAGMEEDVDLLIVEGCVYYDRVWYGDWSVFSGKDYPRSLPKPSLPQIELAGEVDGPIRDKMLADIRKAEQTKEKRHERARTDR